MKTAALVAVAAAALFVLWVVGEGSSPMAVRPFGAVDGSPVADTLDPVPVVEAVEVEPSRTEITQVEDSGAETESVVATEFEEGDLRVVAVDEAGQPLGGVPLGIFHKSGRYRSKRLVTTTTLGSGIGVFKGAAASVAEFTESRPGGHFQVGLDVPGVGLEFVDIDLLAWPKEAIRLTVPASGTLEIRIADEDGSPVVAHNWVYVFPLFEKPSRPGYLQRGDRLTAWVGGASQVTLPYVPAGMKLRLDVHERGLVGKGELEVEALEPGEQRTVAIVVRGALPYVFGRVVLPSGEAVDAPYLKIKSRPAGVSRVEIGPGGAFVLPLSRLRPNSGDRVTVQLRIQLPAPDGTWAAGPTLSGEFDTVAPSAENPSDVGDIVMREVPMFASGIVLDDVGDPVIGVTLTIYEKFNQRSDPEDFGWNSAGVDYVRADASGHFQVVADKPPGEYAIGARAKGYVNRGLVRFLSGTGNLVLSIDRERFLSGTLLLPDGADPTKCLIVAKVPGVTREERIHGSVSGAVSSGGKFALTGLRKAAVSLTVQYGDEKAQLASLHEVLPTESVSQAPSQLDPWDVRKELRPIAFDVRLSDGSPASSGLVAYGAQSLPLEGGRVEALAKMEEDDDVLVVAPGHLPTVLTARALPREVHLVRGIPVRIAIDSPFPAFPDGAEVTVTLERSSRDWLPWTEDEWKQVRHRGRINSLWTESVTIQPGETEWTLHVPAVGSYRPEWRVHHPADHAKRRRPDTRSFSTLQRRYEIEPRDLGAGNQRWLVQPDLAQAKKAFERAD